MAGRTWRDAHDGTHMTEAPMGRYLFNLSYQCSALPNDWKCANVTPLFKKGNPSSVTNYRPISLTCTLCKIMESIIRDNLMEYCLLNNVINVNQHGFIRNKSTCSQLLECQHTSGVLVLM